VEDSFGFQFWGSKEARLCKVISSEQAAMFAPETLEWHLDAAMATHVHK